MLGKLLKYEFRATGRTFLPFLGALLVVSVISRLLGTISSRSASSTGAPYIIGVVISIMLMVAVMALTFILTIQRFRKNLLGDEGYLMFTLPASVDSLIWSKLIVSLVWTIVSTIVVLIAIAIMALANIGNLFQEIGSVINAVFSDGAGTVFACVQVVIFTLISLVESVLSYYMCMSIAMLSNKRRGLVAVGIFVLLMIFFQILGTVVFNIMGADFMETIYRWFDNMKPETMANVVMLIMNLLVAAIGAAMYFVTRFMLKRKLNLE